MKTFNGKVVSDKMKGTVVVEIEQWIVHPLYHKRFRRSKKMHAANNVGAKVGDMVTITETRPISKLTTFKVSEISNKKPVKTEPATEEKPKAKAKNKKK